MTRTSRNLSFAAVLLALLVPTGCGSADDGGDTSACAGNWSGTYEGTDRGVVTGIVQTNGKLLVTFVSGASGKKVEGVATVSSSGSITGSSQGVAVDGSMNLSTCSASGVWTNASAGAHGTWVLQRSTAPPAPDQGTPPAPDQGTPPTPDQGTPPTPDQGTPPTPDQGTPPTPDQGTSQGVAQCAGSYTGTYTGTDTGVTSATLNANGQLVVTFVSAGSGKKIEGTGVVQANGNFSGSGQGVVAVGKMTFANCALSGSWTNIQLGGAGSWNLSKL